MYRNYLKRSFDFTVSLILLIFLIPFVAIAAAAIKIDSSGPVFFTQSRVGRGLVDFTVLKLRTMTHEKREVGDTPVIGKTSGVTKVGYWLRRYKIDELPQLISVLKGQMSLVGPRPSVRKQLVQMTETEKRRYSVRPGLTGLAQVCGNIHLPWKERYRYDLIYVDNISFFNDLKILARTFLLLFKGEAYFKHRPLKISKSYDYTPEP